jgi:hypothetical protein
VVPGCTVRFGECIGMDVQLRLDREVFKSYGIVLVCFYVVNQMRAGGKQEDGRCYLLDNVPVRL